MASRARKPSAPTGAARIQLNRERRLCPRLSAKAAMDSGRRTPTPGWRRHPSPNGSSSTRPLQPKRRPGQLPAGCRLLLKIRTRSGSAARPLASVLGNDRSTRKPPCLFAEGAGFHLLQTTGTFRQHWPVMPASATPVFRVSCHPPRWNGFATSVPPSGNFPERNSSVHDGEGPEARNVLTHPIWQTVRGKPCPSFGIPPQKSKVEEGST